jgi:ABC-type sugar transport system ATPase subunit
MEAMTMGDRIIVMNGGKIQQVDTPKNIYTNPKNYFVAKFIGSPAINTISNELVSYMADFPFTDAYVYCVRPEHIYIEKSIEGNAVITDIELLGKEVHIRLRFNGIENFVVCKQCALDDVGFEVGNKVKCTVEKEKILVFSKENGNRI